MNEKKEYVVGKGKPPKNRQFGQPGGNPICPQHVATQQREFYRWVMTKATEKELQEYLDDSANPYFRKKLIMAVKASERVGDFCELTNQIYGLPKQTIDVQNLPPIDCTVFGDVSVEVSAGED